MAIYNYTRNKLTSGDNIGKWDIDNPDRVDVEEQIYLANEITAAIPAKTLAIPGILCDGASCQINFIESLTTGEETTLITTVNNHKNNV